MVNLLCGDREMFSRFPHAASCETVFYRELIAANKSVLLSSSSVWYLSEVMKITCNLMHIGLTFKTIFVPRIWFQVSGFRCQER
jgi:hypothetical protein